jgi:hypothetical protein
MLSASARKFGLMFRGLRQISLARVRSALHRKRWSAGPFPELILAGPPRRRNLCCGTEARRANHQCQLHVSKAGARKTPAPKVSFVTRVGDIYCGVGCYNSCGTKDRSNFCTHSRGFERLDYSDCAENASQAESSPELNPFMNHRLRCAEVPCVNASGTTYP